MKIIYTPWIICLLLVFYTSSIRAQEMPQFASLNDARLEPYKMEVTYNKTTHLLFPSPIRYVDLGSENLIANKAEDVGNVLRIKAGIKDFEEETNFSVITEDGKFYSFDVFYSSYPDTLNYDLLKLQRQHEKEYSTEVLFEDLKGESASLTQLLMKKLYENSKRKIKHIGNKSFGIHFLLESLYVHEGKFYFIFNLKNKSNIPYNIDFFSFKIVDKRNLKRTVIQDKVLTPIRKYMLSETINHQSGEKAVFLLDQLILSEDQVFEIQVFEKEGGRHQKIQVANTDLIDAQIVKNIHLKLK